MKKKIAQLVMFIFAFAIIFTLASCGLSNSDTDDVNLNIEAAIKSEYKTGFNYTSSELLDCEDVPTAERDFVLEKNEDYDVKYKRVKATYSYNDLCAMCADSNILYPGAMVDIRDGRYTPITLDRAPMTISLNLESMPNSTGKIYNEIDTPVLSKVRKGISDIISDRMSEGDEIPAKISMDIREISSEDEFYMNVGLGMQVSKLNIAEKFSYGNVKRQTNMVIVLKQEYYSVDVDHVSARNFFSSRLTNSEINNELIGKIPAYISSVSYGRIAFITIQTNYSQNEIKNALSVSWGKMSESAGSNGSKKLSAVFDNSLENIARDSQTDISYFVYGGGVDIDGVFGQIGSNSADTISNLFKSLNSSSIVGLPISYQLRDLSGNLVDIQSADEYTVKEVKYLPKKIMDWSYLNNLLQSGEMFTESKIKIDLSAMVDYANPTETNDMANRTITIPSNVTEFYLVGPNNATNSIIYKSLSLRVSFRKFDNPLKIVLSNVSFIADPNPNEGNGVAISSTSAARINLEIDEEVYIEGINNAIECDDLLISGAGRLTIKGGDGLLASESDMNGDSGKTGIKTSGGSIEYCWRQRH